MELVYIDSGYTDFLRETDARVSFNKEESYLRPFVGVVFEVFGHKYFAPMTSHGKGKKLKSNPIKENVTFLPINDCAHGGINFNNMIPVIDGVCRRADLVIYGTDDEKTRKYKGLLAIQWYFISRNREKIKQKAKTIYNLRTKGYLRDSALDRTCDFLKLETVAKLYLNGKKKK